MDHLGALRLEPQGARRAVPPARQSQDARARDHGTKGRRMKETGLARYRPKNFQWRAEGRAGAGAIIALFSDLRYGTRGAKVAFLFTRVGLAGCDMGACAMLPRVIGQGRAAELLYTGRAMSGEEGLAWGFFNALAEPDQVLKTALDAAQQLASGPTFAHGMTKKMLHEERAVGLDQAIEMEAKAQAICMQTKDFRRAYEAFVAKEKPVFEGD